MCNQSLISPSSFNPIAFARYNVPKSTQVASEEKKKNEAAGLDVRKLSTRCNPTCRLRVCSQDFAKLVLFHNALRCCDGDLRRNDIILGRTPVNLDLTVRGCSGSLFWDDIGTLGIILLRR